MIDWKKMKYFCLFKRTYKLKYTLAIMNYSNKNHKIIMNVMNDLLTSIETKSDEHIIKRINQHKNKSLVKIMKTQNLSMEEINARITSEICHNTLLKLSDENYLLLEFDGAQHFKKVKWSNTESEEQINERFEYLQRCDKQKDEYAKNNNHDLLRIRYDDVNIENKILKFFHENYELK